MAVAHATEQQSVAAAAAAAVAEQAAQEAAHAAREEEHGKLAVLSNELTSELAQAKVGARSLSHSVWLALLSLCSFAL
eukprot:6510662-Prymnesium_polylepis.1